MTLKFATGCAVMPVSTAHQTDSWLPKWMTPSPPKRYAEERKMLADPQTSTALWWECAARLPAEAIQSSLFGILTLEDPARWLALVEANAQDWIYYYFQFLQEMRQHAFLTDIIELSIPFQRARGTGEIKRTQRIIRLRRSYEAGKISKKDMARKARKIGALSVYDTENMMRHTLHSLLEFDWTGSLVRPSESQIAAYRNKAWLHLFNRYLTNYTLDLFLDKKERSDAPPAPLP